jgi:hypothetical protein
MRNENNILFLFINYLNNDFFFVILDNQLNKPNHETTITYFNPNFSAGLTAQD